MHNPMERVTLKTKQERMMKMTQNYYQAELETMAVDERKKLQSEKIVKQVKHVYDNVEYYRKLMDEKGVKPEDIKGIDDLYKLPFLSKADLRDAYPYGLLAKPMNECVRIHSTSGTTGRRVVAFYTQNAVDHHEDTLDLTAKVSMAGSVNDIDLCIAVHDSGVFGENCDSALSFEVAGVHDTVSNCFVCAENSALLQKLVNKGGLAVVNVSNDSYVS